MRDMTQGPIIRHMLLFSIPLMLGSMFQQLYGTANSVVVGKVLGKAALASMGTAIPLMNVMFFLLIGMTMGVSILLAEYFGAREKGLLKDQLATALLAGLLFTAALSVAAVAATGPALRAINAPPEIIPQAAAYLRIIFAGLVLTFLFNLLAFAMRAVGEAAVPLLLLIASALLNTGLALLFVGPLGWGVEGAAWATVISQAAATLGCFIYIRLKLPEMYIPLRQIRLKAALLPKTVSFSLAAGLQQTIIFIGVFLVQGAVNPLGVDAIAAFNAVSRLDDFVLIPCDSIAMALMMFISQNRGAGRNERIRKGIWSAVGVSVVYTAGATLVIFLAIPQLMTIFLDPGESAAIALGVKYMKVMCAFYMVSAFCNALQGVFRGLGLIKITLYATLLQIPVRVALAYLLTAWFAMNAIALAIGIGWIFMVSYQVYEYRKRRHHWLSAAALAAV